MGRYVDFYERQSARRRQVLDMAIAEIWISDKRQLRELYELLHEQGLNVAGYKARLEDALKYVNRAIAAFTALED